MIKRMLISILCIGASLLVFSLSIAQESAPAKIADKMAPKDATGDLGKVQGEQSATPVQPTATPVQTLTEAQILIQSTATPVQTLTEAQILTMPKDKQIKMESEEPASPPNILEDPQVRKLLNPEPAFIYNPRDLKDPMIIPWVRNALLVKEYLITLEKRTGEARLEHRKIQEARSLIDQIEELLPDLSDMELKKKSEDRLAKFNEILLQLESEPRPPVDTEYTPEPTIEVPDDITLPKTIRQSFAGVIWHPKAEDRIALFGDEILKEGDTIPRYEKENAIVQKVNPTSCVISFLGKTFEITVEKLEDLK